MSKSEAKRIETRIEFLKNRLVDMNDLIESGQASDAMRMGFNSEAARAIKELQTHGVTVETPSAFLTLAASKAGIPVVAKAGEQRVAVESTPPVAEKFGAGAKDFTTGKPVGPGSATGPLTKK